MRHDDSKLVGRTFEAGAPYLVTAEGIANFCAAVGDRNPLYVDPEAAKLGPYGEIVAPPAFVASFRYTNDVFDQLPRFGRGGLMSGIDFELEHRFGRVTDPRVVRTKADLRKNRPHRHDGICRGPLDADQSKGSGGCAR